jgi:probable phosphomutase (TIGR03848 family)
VAAVTTVLLVRHGRSSANTDGVLAGRTPGVHLDEAGRNQVAAAAARIGVLNVAEVVTSPLERCRETAGAIAAAQAPPRKVRSDRRLLECGYGQWTGRELKKLAKEPLWRAVQQHPSSVTFPEGESMRDMQARAVSAVRDWDRRVEAEYGPEAVWVAVSHADVIKAVVADALGVHLDHFQRIVVDPASVTAITYTPLRPFVVRLNDTGGDLSAFRPPKRRRRRARSSDAPVGGGAGTPVAPAAAETP